MDAFQHLVRRYQAILLAHLAGKLGSKDKAEEAAQVADELVEVENFWVIGRGHVPAEVVEAGLERNGIGDSGLKGRLEPEVDRALEAAADPLEIADADESPAAAESAERQGEAELGPVELTLERIDAEFGPQGGPGLDPK